MKGRKNNSPKKTMSRKYKFHNPEGFRFWRTDNKPIELWSKKVTDEKIDYFHNNQVVEGLFSGPKIIFIAALLIMPEKRVCLM
jgi:hypothetical protein